MPNIETGSKLHRLALGGVQLTKFEDLCITKLVELVPVQIRKTLVEQLKLVSLVQREVGGRTLNFYATKFGRVNWKTAPMFKTNKDSAKLLKFDLRPEKNRLLHVNFWVVNGHFFQITFSEDVSSFSELDDFDIVGAKQSWRSEIIT